MMRRHLRKCGPCTDEWEGLHKLSRVASSITTETVSADLAEAAWAQRSRVIRRARPRRIAAFWAAAAAAVGMVGYGLFHASAPSAADQRDAAWLAEDDRLLAAQASMPMPKPNGMDDILAAADLLDASGGTARIWREGTGLMNLAGEKAVVARNQPALRRLRLGLSRPCRVVRYPPDDDPYGPEHADARELSRLLLADGDVAVARGDYDGAARAAVDAVRLGSAVSNFGAMVDSLAGDACIRNGTWPLVRSIERMDARQCRRVSAGLASAIRTRPPASAAILNERTPFRQWLAQMPSGGPARRWLANPDRMERDLALYYARWRRMADRPARVRRPIAVPQGVVWSLLSPAVDRFPGQHDIATARLRCQLAALLVRAYRLENGRLPSGLAEAGVPQDLRQDPFTGDDLIYRPNPAGFLLYSVGPDLRDSGGAPWPENLGVGPGDLGVARYGRPVRGEPTVLSNGRLPYMMPDAGGQAGPAR